MRIKRKLFLDGSTGLEIWRLRCWIRRGRDGWRWPYFFADYGIYAFGFGPIGFMFF